MDVRQLAKEKLPAPFIDGMRLVNSQADLLRFRAWRLTQPETVRVEKPIFMVGCPRSGTTIGVELFARHPWVANRSEAGTVWDPKHYYDPQGDHVWGKERVTEEEAKRLHAYFEYSRRRANKKRIVNKHPRNSLRIDFLEEIFPDAHYIHLIRDGRAVAHSIMSRIAREDWRHPIPYGNFCKPPNWRSHLRDDPAEQAALQWREIVSYLRDRREKLGERYIEIKYETMCTDTRAVFSQLYAFTGLPLNEDTLSRVPANLRNENQKYKNELTPEQLATIERIQRPLLEELGYWE